MVDYQEMLQEQFDQMALICLMFVKVIGHNVRARFFGTQCSISK